MNIELTRSQFRLLEILESCGHLSDNDIESQDFRNLCEIGVITNGGGGT